MIGSLREGVIAYVIPGRGINDQHEEDQQSAFHRPHELFISYHRSWGRGGVREGALLLIPLLGGRSRIWPLRVSFRPRAEWDPRPTRGAKSQTH